MDFFEIVFGNVVIFTLLLYFSLHNWFVKFSDRKYWNTFVIFIRRLMAVPREKFASISFSRYRLETGSWNLDHRRQSGVAGMPIS